MHLCPKNVPKPSRAAQKRWLELPLIRHDWLIVRNIIGDMFAGWWNRVFLAVGAIIGVAWLVQMLRAPAAPLELRLPTLLVAAATLAGFGTYRGAARRLHNFVEHSPLCFEALNPAGRRAYHVLWQAGVALTVTMTAAFVHARDDSIGFGLGVAGFAAQLLGIAASWLLLKVWTSFSFVLSWRATSAPKRHLEQRLGDTQWWSVIAQTQILHRRSGVAALAIIAGVGMVVAASASTVLTENQSNAWISTGLLTTAGVLLLTRVDEQVVRFSAFAGTGALASAIAHWPAPMAFAAGGAIILVLWGFWTGTDLLLQLLAVGLPTAAALSIVTVRVWQSRLMPLASADRALLVDAAACLMLGLLFWPLALAWAVLRLMQLYHRSRAATWALS